VGEPQSTVTSVGQIVTLLRDGVATIGVCYLGWKVRDWIQPAIDFFKKANIFMDESTKNQRALNEGMVLLLNNHLPHIEKALGVRRGYTVEVAEPMGTTQPLVDDPTDKEL